MHGIYTVYGTGFSRNVARAWYIYGIYFSRNTLNMLHLPCTVFFFKHSPCTVYIPYMASVFKKRSQNMVYYMYCIHAVFIFGKHFVHGVLPCNMAFVFKNCSPSMVYIYRIWYFFSSNIPRAPQYKYRIRYLFWRNIPFPHIESVGFQDLFFYTLTLNYNPLLYRQFTVRARYVHRNQLFTGFQKWVKSRTKR